MNQVATKKEGALAVNLFEADANGCSKYIARRSCVTFLKNFGSIISRGQQKRW